MSIQISSKRDEKILEHLGELWYKLLRKEFDQQYMKRVSVRVRAERQRRLVYPKSDQVFRAFKTTPFDKVKVVIVGQDPYPHAHANGLAFSTNESMDNVPASLRNIFVELENDIGFQPYHNPDLTRWAEQGVLLLNRVLTVTANKPKSHRDFGWQRFTYKAIWHICQKNNPVVFILWGREAQVFTNKIPDPHHVIVAPHPSPLSAYRGFFGHKPFSMTNKYLEASNQTPINWLKDDF